MDSTPLVPLGWALLIDTLLVSLFGLQHSMMARPTFKRWWTNFVPEPTERSTYVMLRNACADSVVRLLAAAGRDGVGDPKPGGPGRTVEPLRLGMAGRARHDVPDQPFRPFWIATGLAVFPGQGVHAHRLSDAGLYQFVRHPLYLGWITVFWATPTMTLTHLVFTLGLTIYILIAIPFEERNLVQYHGKNYADYRRRVPMLIPGIGKRSGRHARRNSSDTWTAICYATSESKPRR